MGRFHHIGLSVGTTGRVVQMQKAESSQVKEDDVKNLRRGDLCRAVASQISLPPAGSCPVPMARLSPRAQHFLDNMEEKMLDPEGDEKMRESDVKPFVDPALRSRRSAIKLACRLWVAGLLRGAKKARGFIYPFTVVKKLTVEPARSIADVIMRMVLDQRVSNLAWLEPPWTPMSNPSSFPYVECSADVLGESDQVEMMTGDLPDWYWTLELPEGMEEYFILDQVSPTDLKHALQKDYKMTVSFGEEITALGMRVPVMGWAWAVTLAHWVLEDLLEKAISEFRASSRLHYKVVLPQFSASRKVLHWEFIDDVGALVLGKKGDQETTAAKELGLKTRQALKKEGFGYHKDEYGLEAISLGHEIAPATYGIRVARKKFWHGVGALEHLLSTKVETAETLESLISFWCWASLVTRCALSIWCRTYGYIEMAREKGMQKIPEEVLEEFQACLFLSPLFEARMDISWLSETFMVDSCFEGAGVVETTATGQELREEAQFAETKGWSVFLTEVETVIETREEIDSSQNYDPMPKAVPLKKIRALHTFSGPRRKNDFEYFMKVVASTTGIYMIVESIDPLIGAAFNLMDDGFYGGLLQAAAAGAFMIHLSGPPCSTWSIARFRKPGPPVVRTREFPFGIPGLSVRLQTQVAAHSQLMRRAFEISRAVMRAGGLFAIENPKDPGADPYPSMFATEEARELREEAQGWDVVFDQCMTDLNFMKPTQILTNALGVKTRLMGLVCTHGKGAHPNMGGVDENGDYVTKAQSRYTDKLSRLLAEGFSDDFERLAVREILEEKEKDEPEKAWIKARAPPISKCWDPLGRWHETFRTNWARREHNNIGELRISILTLKHLARSQRCWDKRVLIMTDSLVGLGVITKGRSSSWPLLRLARQGAAIQLALGIRPYMRYVETSRNHADGPSRGFGIGHAPEWVHQSEAIEKRAFTMRRKVRSSAVLKKKLR